MGTTTMMGGGNGGHRQLSASSNAAGGGHGATSHFVDLTKSPPPAPSALGKQAKESTAPCPVCNKEVPESVINLHLDECLNLSALSQGERSPIVINSPVEKTPSGSSKSKTSTPAHG